MYIPEGPKRPDPAELELFWRGARKKFPDLSQGPACQVRWIGLDHESTEQVIELIVQKDKTGTFTLPWIVERTDRLNPAVGLPVILIDFSGRPRLLVRLTRIHEVNFGAITEADTAIDGSPVRSLEVWRPLHIQYWNAMLAPFDLTVSDDMPVLIEAFELLEAA